MERLREGRKFALPGRVCYRQECRHIWEITPTQSTALYYVGRTGDSSSTNAQSPFNRMGQHLGFAKNSTMLRRHLCNHGIDPEQCTFRLVALGPIDEESKAMARKEHDQRRDVLASMEKALAEAMTEAGYRVMNKVTSRRLLDATRFAEVHAAFALAFPLLVRQESAAPKGVH